MVPSSPALRGHLKLLLEARGPSHAKRLSMGGPGPPGVIRVDAPYKICKLIKIKLSTKSAACCYTAMSGDGIVLGSWLLAGGAKSALAVPIKGVRGRFFQVPHPRLDWCCALPLG